MGAGGIHAPAGRDCAVAVDRRYADLGARGTRQGQLPTAFGNLADSRRAVVGSSCGTIALRVHARRVAMGPAVQPPRAGGASSCRARRAAVGVSLRGAGTALFWETGASRGPRAKSPR